MSFISFKEKIDRIKRSVDPVVFYEQEQGPFRPCRNKSWNVVGLCPFHDDQTPGSFSVHLESGGFHCFSCGAKGGDIISYTQQKYQLGFRQALEKLMSEWGVR